VPTLETLRVVAFIASKQFNPLTFIAIHSDSCLSNVFFHMKVIQRPNQIDKST